VDVGSTLKLFTSNPHYTDYFSASCEVTLSSMKNPAEKPQGIKDF